MDLNQANRLYSEATFLSNRLQQHYRIDIWLQQSINRNGQRRFKRKEDVWAQREKKKNQMLLDLDILKAKLESLDIKFVIGSFDLNDDGDDQKNAANVPALEAVSNEEIGGGAQEDFAEDDLEWINDLDFVSLNAKIRDLNVREYLQDVDTLDTATIHDIRAKLAVFMSTKAEGSLEQWEAFHLDMYYETALQRIRNKMN